MDQSITLWTRTPLMTQSLVHSFTESSPILSILLCSTSPLKTQALIEFFKESSPSINITVTNYDCSALNLPAQPIDSTLKCAKERLNYAKDNNTQKYDMYVSIENGLIISPFEDYYIGAGLDECCVIIEVRGMMCIGKDYIRIPIKYKDFVPQKKDSELGNNITFGELLQKQDPDIDPKNWMKTICTYDRIDMIKQALDLALDDQVTKQTKIDKVIKTYKAYPDFPKPGVLFQDIFAVLANGPILNILCEVMKNRYYLDKLDYVVGLESRGFFGVLLAKELGIGFIPIRKAGKLPGPVERVEYGTEYSKDVCEMSTSIPEGSRVLVFDDLIATGGSLKASVTLLTKLKCHIVDLCVLREVPSLRSKAIETLGHKYTVLLQE